MPDPDEPERLTSYVSTGAGSTRMELDLFESRAVLHVRSRWMGQPALDVAFALRHRVLGSHSGALVVETAQERGNPIPLPPCDGPLVLEYARVPPQPSKYAGSGTMAMVGASTDPWTLLLWLHPDVMYDDGTQLPPEEYDAPPDDFAPVVRALRELERPWKLG